MRCPSCRSENTVSIRRGFTARQLGTFSLSGNQMKVSAHQVAVAECSAEGCELHLVGYLEGATFAEDGRTFTGGHFVLGIPPE